MGEHDEDYKPYMVIPGNPDSRKVFPQDINHSIENIDALKPEPETVYGLPDKKKYPMPDRDHVLSAIRFFNYVDPLDERKLAKAILKRMDELDITDINVGEVNRFKQYYDKKFLKHHGVDGMKWGVWNEETAARYSGKDRIFVSGSSKTQDKESGYYRRKLPFEVRQDIKQGIKAGSTFLVGDAPGIDRQVQDYLKSKKYDKVEIYGPGKEVRYQADKTWKTKPVDAPQYKKGSKEWLREKDIAMTNDSTKGLAVILDDGANATRNNVKRLKEQSKNVKVYALDGASKHYDSWVQSDDVIKDKVKKRLKKNRQYLNALALSEHNRIQQQIQQQNFDRIVNQVNQQNFNDFTNQVNQQHINQMHFM